MNSEDELSEEELKAIQAAGGEIRDLRRDPLTLMAEPAIDVEIDSFEEVIFSAKPNTPVVQRSVIFDENAPYPSMGEGFSAT